MSSVIVMAPHPDDESIGCGGMIHSHARNGERVIAVFLTSGEAGIPGVSGEEVCRIRETEARAAAEILGIQTVAFLRCRDGNLADDRARAADLLAPILKTEAPELIYLPHDLESHPDHRVALSIVEQAIAESAIRRPRLAGYEVWSPLAQYDSAHDITSWFACKLRAIRCYHSQLQNLRYDRAAQGLNRYRGVIARGSRYAEVFRHY
jgi:LmbE family N-acetylglucosaminyl deacetylase